jgi:hypothetical protein
MRMIATLLLATAATSGLCLNGLAGEVEKLPVSGKAKFQVSYIQYASRDLQLADDAGFGTFEVAGLTRNVEGKSWFDRMTEHCVGQYYWGDNVDVPTNGACLYLDADGDKVMINFTGAGPGGGTKQVVGGTGKYAGISGKGTYTTVELKTPAEGVMAYLVDVDLDFQIKQPTQ